MVFTWTQGRHRPPSLGALLVLVLSLLTLPAVAMSVTPMGLEMVSLGKSSRSQFVVSNNSSAALPVEIVYELLSYDENGRRSSSKANDELLILPATALIPPGRSQTFRLQWVGNPDLAESATFVVYAKQLPVRLPSDNNKSQIQVVGAFGVIVNVAPPTGRAALRFVSWRPTKDVEGHPAVAVVVENPTNVHALMSRAHLHIGELSLGPDALLQRVGFGVVGPHRKRTFTISLNGLGARPSGNGSISYRNDDR